MCVFVSVHMCVEARSQLRCCFSGTIDLEFGDVVSPLCLRLTNLARLTAQQAPGICTTVSPHHWHYKSNVPYPPPCLIFMLTLECELRLFYFHGWSNILPRCLIIISKVGLSLFLRRSTETYWRGRYWFQVLRNKPSTYTWFYSTRTLPGSVE